MKIYSVVQAALLVSALPLGAQTEAAGVVQSASLNPFIGQVVVTHVFNKAGESPDPQFGLLEMANGDFMGITQGTGGNGSASRMIYRMTPTGQVTVLATFANNSGQLGFHLFEGSGNFQLMQASNGNFYGVSNGQFPDLGNIYSITPAGVYSVVYSFNGNAGGVSAGQGGLAEGLDGYLYGFGGGNSPGGWGIYKLNPATGAVTWIYYDTTLNTLPTGTPVFTDGHVLVGISLTAPPPSQSEVFSFDTSTSAYTPLALLTSDQAYNRTFSDPVAVDPDGSIWFTTMQGNFTQPGCPPNCSNIIQVAAGRAETLYSFPAGSITAPASLIRASDGNHYGDVYNPVSATGQDSLFQFTSSAFTLNTYATPQRGGTSPTGPLTQVASGNLVGTHGVGGDTGGSGATFVLNTGLPKPLPSIRGFAPVSGSAGTVVTVLGSHFVHVTSVTVNGHPTRFTNVASGAVKFVIPPGATTGSIAIATPAGSGASASALQVN